jgi:hypothetical protein
MGEEATLTKSSESTDHRFLRVKTEFQRRNCKFPESRSRQYLDEFEVNMRETMESAWAYEATMEDPRAMQENREAPRNLPFRVATRLTAEGEAWPKIIAPFPNKQGENTLILNSLPNPKGVSE